MDNHWNDKIKYGMLLKSIFFDLESKSISKNNITEEQKKKKRKDKNWKNKKS